MHKTASKGDIGVAYAIADLTEKGWDVLAPICASSPFDLVIYRPIYRAGNFKRVQVKYREPRLGRLEVTLRRAIIAGGKVRYATNDEVDVVCIFCPTTRLCYYVAPRDCPIYLRISEPENGQRKGIKFARDYLTLAE